MKPLTSSETEMTRQQQYITDPSDRNFTSQSINNSSYCTVGWAVQTNRQTDRTQMGRQDTDGQTGHRQTDRQTMAVFSLSHHLYSWDLCISKQWIGTLIKKKRLSIFLLYPNIIWRQFNWSNSYGTNSENSLYNRNGSYSIWDSWDQWVWIKEIQ